MSKWVALGLSGPEQVDDEVLDWLTEAFHQSEGPVPAGGSDPMIPDDIDEDFLGDAW